MHELVKEFLDAQRSAEKEKYEEEKIETLMKLGLYEREYSLYDGEYYKKIPIEVTDEEYEEIKKYLNKKSSNDSPDSEPINTYFNPDNKIAFTFQILGWVSFVIGIIVSLVMITTGKIFAFLGWLSGAFILGMPMLGFAEIINLLEAIKNKKVVD